MLPLLLLPLRSQCSSQSLARFGLTNGRQNELVASFFKHALHGGGRVEDEMESVRHLLRIGGANTGAFCVETAAMARNRGNPRMLL